MTNAVARANGSQPAAIDRELVRRTVAQGATDDELELYLYDCRRRNIHPLDKLLHFTKRGGRYVPITSIDLMRARAADTGQLAGSDDATFEVGAKTLISATVTVYRLTQGQRFAYTGTARWAEYNAGGTMWQKMPHTMLAKCAEALALRKAFPQELAGLYSREEMDQADAPVRENPHVNRPEDIVDVPAADDPDRLPDGNPNIRALPKKNARNDFANIQEEMRTFDDPDALLEWGKFSADRVATYPEDWREIFRGIFKAHLTQLRVAQKMKHAAQSSAGHPENGTTVGTQRQPHNEGGGTSLDGGDPLDVLTDAYSACADAAAMFEIDQKLYIPFVQTASPDDRERANDIRQQHLDRIEGATQ